MRTTHGQRMTHMPCSGDGWIRVGSRWHRRQRTRRSTTISTTGAGALFVGLGNVRGTTGQILAVVVILLVVVLKLVLRGVAAVVS